MMGVVEVPYASFDQAFSGQEGKQPWLLSLLLDGSGNGLSEFSNHFHRRGSFLLAIDMDEKPSFPESEEPASHIGPLADPRFFAFGFKGENAIGILRGTHVKQFNENGRLILFQVTP